MARKIRLILSLLVFMSLFAAEISEGFAATMLPNTNKKMPGSFVRVYDSEIPGYYKFINGRFGFSVDFPQSFNVGFLPANSDGARFSTPDGSASLTVSGGRHGPEWTLDDSLNKDLQRVQGVVGYTSKGEDWYVVSWKQDGAIYYEKVFMSDQYRNGFILSYLESQKNDFNEIVANIEKAFIPGWKSGRQILG
jgi:hypothetical protein